MKHFGIFRQEIGEKALAMQIAFVALSSPTNPTRPLIIRAIDIDQAMVRAASLLKLIDLPLEPATATGDDGYLKFFVAELDPDDVCGPRHGALANAPTLFYLILHLRGG